MSHMQRGTFVVLNPVKRAPESETWWEKYGRYQPTASRGAFHAEACARAAQMSASTEGKAINALRKDNFPKRYQSEGTR